MTKAVEQSTMRNVAVVDGPAMRTAREESKPRMAALGEERRRLVRENMGIVAVHLRRFVAGVSARRSDREWDDLFQEGCLGLIRAAAEFQPERGIPFVAFALPRIHTAVRRALLAQTVAAAGPQRELVPTMEHNETGSRGDPNRPPKRRSMSAGAARRLRDSRRHAPDTVCGETVGQRLREKYERAVRCAAEEVLRRVSIRGDRDKLVRALTEERYLVPHEDEKRSYRKIAAQTRSSYARVAQCDKHMSDAVRRALEADPEFAELKRMARSDPKGVDAPIDEAMDRILARTSAAEFLARFRRTDDARRASLMKQLLSFSAGEIERFIGAEIERLPESVREQLHRASAPEPTAAAH
jgi:hypothetical protein